MGTDKFFIFLVIIQIVALVLQPTALVSQQSVLWAAVHFGRSIWSWRLIPSLIFLHPLMSCHVGKVQANPNVMVSGTSTAYQKKEHL